MASSHSATAGRSGAGSTPAGCSGGQINVLGAIVAPSSSLWGAASTVGVPGSFPALCQACSRWVTSEVSTTNRGGRWGTPMAMANTATTAGYPGAPVAQLKTLVDQLVTVPTAQGEVTGVVLVCTERK